MDAVANGRALPPRPTLLVGEAGDVEACRSSWAKLQPVAEELLRRAEAECASADELESAVRRFRSLRESLVAAYVRDELAIQVYECSADVCLAARCWPEFLKSVAALTADLYPDLDLGLGADSDLRLGLGALSVEDGNKSEARGAWADGATTATTTSAQQQQQQEGGRGRQHDTSVVLGAAAASAAPAAGCSGSDGVGGGGGVGGRRGEMFAAHCLFLACVPSGRVSDAAAQLRNPRTLSYLSYTPCCCSSPSSSPAPAEPHSSGGGGDSLLRFTVKVLSSLAGGDWHSFLSLRDAAPRRSLRAILDVRAPQVRTAALRAMCAAFRSLPLPAAAAMLRLHPARHPSTQQPGPVGSTHGSEEEEGGEEGLRKALRAALAEAAAAGVRGAGVALEGWRSAAWGEEPCGGASGPPGAVPQLAAVELCFRA